MRLVVTSGSQAGRALDVERRLVVGRDEGCDLVLEEDEKVSRRHCAFSPNPDGTLTVEDMGSSNGTFVAGERLAAPAVLRGGEEVRVGSTLIRAEREQALREIDDLTVRLEALLDEEGVPGAPDAPSLRDM